MKQKTITANNHTNILENIGDNRLEYWGLS